MGQGTHKNSSALLPHFYSNGCGFKRMSITDLMIAFFNYDLNDQNVRNAPYSIVIYF